MATEVWEDYNDNWRYGQGSQDSRDCDTILDRSQRHIVLRRNGERIWLPHKCINCGASIEKCISWTRRYYHEYGEVFGHPGDGSFKADPDWPDRYIEAMNRYDVRFFEQCTKCGRTMSWPYIGVAPKGWKAPEMPTYYGVKDFQRNRLYVWQDRVFDHLIDQFDTHTECGRFVNRMFDKYKLKRCKMVYRSAQEAGASRVRATMLGRSRMTFNPQGLRRRVAVHEFAHAIMATLWELQPIEVRSKARRPSAHGAEYMAIYMVLMDEFMGEYVNCPQEQVVASARSAKLLVADLEWARTQLDWVKIQKVEYDPIVEEEEVDNV